MFGIFEVFADTVVICTVTALAILMSGCADQFYRKAAGTDLTILSFGTTFRTKTASIIIATYTTMSVVYGDYLHAKHFVSFGKNT